MKYKITLTQQERNLLLSVLMASQIMEAGLLAHKIYNYSQDTAEDGPEVEILTATP